jgi:myo-inositol-1-phosphate synthase
VTSRTGVWFIGARGSVAVTAAVGALALRAGLVERTGLVSALDEVAAAELPGVEDLVVGGHDVSTVRLAERAAALASTGVLPPVLVGALRPEIDRLDARLRLGVDSLTQSQRDAARRVEEEIRAFREANELDRVVVVDVSSTEPPHPVGRELTSVAALEVALDRGESPLATSSLYAYAAFRAGCPVVAFTPSPGPRIPALEELARLQGLPWAGSDGKTGETLVKTALAPMFATRALRVRSWASYNLLGGGDGATLADPAARESKTTTKANGLQAILGHPVDGPLHIDYVPDLGDWKTAWDHVSFEGFLGVRMSMQFTWAGCDSALAAPLVLDLVRLVSRAHEVGQTGALGALGFFFKDPAGSSEHRLAEQWENLVAFCAKLGAAG